MAEFCYDCYKRILHGAKKENQLVMSDEEEICEGCGEYKFVVEREKTTLGGVICGLLNPYKNRGL